MVRTDDAVGDNGQQPTETVRTPGALLREARDRAGLSRAQLAEETNLLLSQVVAIDEDRYDQLPGDTFTIGYLRNYARVVGIDADSVVRAFFSVRPQSRPMNRRVAGDVVTPNPTRKPMRLDQTPPRRHFWSLGAAAMVVAGLWGWHQIKAPVEVLPLTADINGVELPLPGGLEQVGDTSSLLDAVELLPGKPATVAATPELGPTRAVADMGELRQPTLVSASESAVSAQRSASNGDAPGVDTDGDRLNLRFSADCWVEVKDRDNKVLVAALKRADEQLTVEGRGPFKVLLGFAPGVEMAFNGRPVDIDAPSGSRSARLIVGNS